MRKEWSKIIEWNNYLFIFRKKNVRYNIIETEICRKNFNKDLQKDLYIVNNTGKDKWDEDDKK